MIVSKQLTGELIAVFDIFNNPQNLRTKGMKSFQNIRKFHNIEDYSKAMADVYLQNEKEINKN